MSRVNSKNYLKSTPTAFPTEVDGNKTAELKNSKSIALNEIKTGVPRLKNNFINKNFTTSSKSELDKQKLNNNESKISLRNGTFSSNCIKPDLELVTSGSSFKVNDRKKNSMENIINLKVENKKSNENREKVINNMYRTIKQTNEKLFKKKSCEKFLKDKFLSRNKKEFGVDVLNNQEDYDYTLEEIYKVWINAINLIRSVRDHTIMYKEEKKHSIDSEQLSLEIEMLQVGIDFALTFSKFKSDFLVKRIRDNLKGNQLPKTELELFVDSKIIAPVYDDDDLQAMAQTIVDFNNSVHKPESEDH